MTQADAGDHPELRALGALDADERTSVVDHLLETSIDLLAVLGRDTRPVALSRSWEPLLGWSRDELRSTRFLDLVHPDQQPLVSQGLDTILGGGSVRGLEVQMRTKDGTYRWLQGGAVGDPETGRIYLTVVDVHERKEIEAALRAQLDLEEVVASVVSGLIGLEPDAVEPAIQQALGTLGPMMGVDRVHFLRGVRYPEDVTLLEWYDPALPQPTHVPHPDPEVQAWWLDALRAGRVLRYEDLEDLRPEAPKVVDALQEDGVRALLHIPLPPLRRTWGFLTFVAIRDHVLLSERATALLRVVGESFLTALLARDSALELADARRELELRNAALERSNEELERFAFAAAHDLKAPLARVEMALAAAPPAAGAAGDLLDIARRGAGRMHQLIEDLLAFASVGRSTGSTEEVDLDGVLAQVLSDLEPVMAAGSIRVEHEPLPVVTGHRSLLGQLLQNLLGNAVKFARVGGDAVVRVSGHSGEDGHLIVVADNGIGVEPDQREEVFGVFKRLNPDDTYPGSGVGLATCARVVEHHGGRIWLEDGIDGGIAVHVWLPRQAPDEVGPIPPGDLLGGGLLR